MDIARAFDDRLAGDAGSGGSDAAGRDPAAGIGNDERRMHVRAYNHWVSLLHGRAYPSIDDLDPVGIVDFGAHSVLLDFTSGIDDPSIRFLGRSLREECALDPSVTRIADVPSRSLLSRLTDHYLQIIANRAPIGFEAEFVGTRGRTTLYRGILMPFSSDENTIDFIYGVINWKELLDISGQTLLAAELDASVRAQATVTPPSGDVAVWADGPGAGTPPGAAPLASASEAQDAAEVEEADDVEEDAAPLPAAPLADRLSIARESAAIASAEDTRSQRALYRALSRAHDFALAAAAEPESYADLLADAGITGQPRAPMTPIVKLVFGGAYDKTRVTEFATVLAAARDASIPAGGLLAWLDQPGGGIKGVVQAARNARRAVSRPARPARTPRGFGGRATIARFAFATEAPPGSPVLLVARAAANGEVEIVGTVADAGLVRRAVAAIG